MSCEIEIINATPSPKGLPQLILNLIVAQLQLDGMLQQSLTSGENNGLYMMYFYVQIINHMEVANNEV